RHFRGESAAREGRWHGRDRSVAWRIAGARWPRLLAARQSHAKRLGSEDRPVCHDAPLESDSGDVEREGLRREAGIAAQSNGAKSFERRRKRFGMAAVGKEE